MAGQPEVNAAAVWAPGMAKPEWMEELGSLVKAASLVIEQEVVPKQLQEKVLQQLHGGIGAGHFGVSKTLKRVRQGFYWARRRSDVEDFCRQCDQCAAKKGPPGQSHALLQQFPVGEPMERLGVDIVGQFPITDSGNRWILWNCYGLLHQMAGGLCPP